MTDGPPTYKRGLLEAAKDAAEPVTEVSVNDSGRTTRIHAIQDHDGTAHRAQITVHEGSDGWPSVQFGTAHWDADHESLRKWSPLATGRLSGPQHLPEWERLFTVFNAALDAYRRHQDGDRDD